LRRLDLLLVRRGIFPSRSRAKEAILQGQVLVDGRAVKKPGRAVPAEAGIEIKGQIPPYPGRGGLKLAGALEKFSIDVAGLTAIDVGASTGGFTSCLLQNGAKLVYAVDVGRGQLVQGLRDDPRVVVMEGVNIRYLRPKDLPAKADLAVIDVSFISLTKVVPAVEKLLTAEGLVVALVKPQFETEGRGLNKHGVVWEQETHLKYIPPLIESLQKRALALQGFAYSPLTGSAGNIEYLAYFQKNTARPVHNKLVEEVIKKAWGFHRGQ